MSLRAASLQECQNAAGLLARTQQELEFLLDNLNGPEPITRSGHVEVLEALAELMDRAESTRSMVARAWLAARAIRPMPECRTCERTLIPGEISRGTCAACHALAGHKCASCGRNSLLMVDEKKSGLCWTCVQNGRASCELCNGPLTNIREAGAGMHASCVDNACHACGNRLDTLTERDARTCGDCMKNAAQRLEA